MGYAIGKKLTKTLLVTLLAFFSVNILMAADGDLWDFIDGLADEIPFGYTNDKISVKDITTSEIIVESPVIYGELGEDIEKYILMYTESSLTDIIDNPTLLDDSEELIFEFDHFDNNKFELILTTNDGIDPDKIYYLLVSPVDATDIQGEISNEICFRLSDKIYGEGDSCSNDAQDLSSIAHGAGPNMNLANVTHTTNGSKITLKWTSVDDDAKVDIFVWDEDTERFTKITTANMSDEQYIYTASSNGEYNFKFIPIDDNGDEFGKETTYTLTVTSITSTPTPNPTPTPTPNPNPNPGITKVPTVGAEQNILLIVMISLAGYLGYRMFRKAKH